MGYDEEAELFIFGSYSHQILIMFIFSSSRCCCWDFSTFFLFCCLHLLFSVSVFSSHDSGMSREMHIIINIDIDLVLDNLYLAFVSLIWKIIENLYLIIIATFIDRVIDKEKQETT